MSTIREVAHAFTHGRKARCGNAATDGESYFLHENRIAARVPKSDHFTYDWCGYYTKTTALHLNAIRNEIPASRRVHPQFSYAWSRDNGDDTGFIS